MTVTVTAIIQLRKGTAAAWTSANTVLLLGEEGYETDTGKRKIGDGTTAWNSLAYQKPGVTNGDSHDHVGGDGAQIAYASLSGLPTLGTAAAQNTTAFETAGAVSTHAASTTAHGISAFGASLVDDASASAARTTLGLGTAATTASGDYATAGHTHAQLHDPVTVSDSTSIDLTLTGQQISAAAIFGTTSGTVCQGNDSRVVNAVKSDTTGIAGADQVTNIVSLTQAEYDAIGSKSATTLYFIVG